jgi:hypothetical protein
MQGAVLLALLGRVRGGQTRRASVQNGAEDDYAKWRWSCVEITRPESTCVLPIDFFSQELELCNKIHKSYAQNCTHSKSERLVDREGLENLAEPSWGLWQWLHFEWPQLGTADFCAENVRRDQQLPNDRSRKALSWMWGLHPEERTQRRHDMFKM